MSSPNHVAELAATLGIPLFNTDRYLPGYRDSCVGRWRLTRSGFMLDCGYRTGLWATYDMPVLLRDTDGCGQSWETWMSLSPHEIESQELGCLHAYGHTAVMGLGMGWVAINMALNAAVNRVSVIERDPEVIALFGQSGALDGLAWTVTEKIRIIQADALEWQPDLPVDFLYADIWQSLEEPRTLDDVRRMQANVQADAIYFWGQELAIHTLAGTTPEACSDGCGWAETVRRCVGNIIALPLLLPDDFDYPGMIAQVVARRRERKANTVKGEAIPAIIRRPITDDDLGFLFQLYASTRFAEKELFGWGDEQWNEFLRMQFHLQHTQYMQNYRNPTFDIVMLGQTPVGRLYVDRRPDEIRIIDISLLPEYRGRGVGAGLMGRIMQEGDDRGIPVTLHVEKNSPALALYRRLGFRIEGDSGVFWFMERSPAGAATPIREQRAAVGSA